jgi:outer membrane protein
MEKKITFLSILILFFALALLGNVINAQASNFKIAVINMQKIFSLSKQGKAANSIFSSMVKKYKSKLAKLRQKVTSLGTYLKQNASIMTAAQKAKKIKEFESSEAKYSSESRHVRGVLTQKNLELAKGVFDKADVIINKIAKKKGYLLVINRRPSVIYRSNSINITNQVLNAMNSK